MTWLDGILYPSTFDRHCRIGTLRIGWPRILTISTRRRIQERNSRRNDNDDDEDDDDVIIEYSLAEADSILPADCPFPFTFLYLSSEDSTRGDAIDEIIQDSTLPDSTPTRQGTTNVSVTAEQILRSDGLERKKWIDAGRKELDNLTGTKTTTNISPQQREELKRKARATGQKYIELPAKAVFTIKPDKFKVRVVACGKKTEETFGRTSTTDLDTGMMWYIISRAASLPDCSIASLDVTAAFLNTPLPDHPLQVRSFASRSCMVGAQGYLWIARGPHFTGRRAYRRARKSDTFTVEGEPHCILLSQIHRSLCLIVRKASLLDQPLVDHLGLTTTVLPEDIVAISGIYVGDFLTAGPKIVVHSYLATLRRCGRHLNPLALHPNTSRPGHLNFLRSNCGISCNTLAQLNR